MMLAIVLCPIEYERMTSDVDFLALRRSLMIPIPALARAIDLLAAAADAILAGQLDDARRLVIRADDPEVHAYAARIMGRIDRDVHRLRSVRDVAPAPARVASRMPSATVKRDIFRRDFHRCRFCDIRVLAPNVRSAMDAALPGAVRWGATNATQHAAFFALSGTIDHVVPHARGGGNEPSNLLTTCWPCNFGRGGHSLAEMGLIDPRDRGPIDTGWDGLERLSSQPRSQPKSKRSTMSPATDKNAVFFKRIGEVAPFAPQQIRDLLTACEAPDFSCALNEVLTMRLHVSGYVIAAIGIEPAGDVHVPWMVGKQYAASRVFTDAIAAAIPGAEAYDSKKLRQVRIGGKGGRNIHVAELLAAAPAVVSAFDALRSALAVQASGATPSS